MKLLTKELWFGPIKEAQVQVVDLINLQVNNLVDWQVRRQVYKQVNGDIL